MTYKLYFFHKDWHLLGRQFIRPFRKCTIPSSGWFETFSLTVCSLNAAFFQMNEKLCKRPGALTYFPPAVTSRQLINQMSRLLCLHKARTCWLVLVDLTITPQHIKLALGPSLIFPKTALFVFFISSQRPIHQLLGLTSTWYRWGVLVLIHVGHDRGADT